MPTVGVAPGTTTIRLAGLSENKQLIISNPYVGGNIQLGEIPKPRLRWDLIGVVGGGALIVALTASLIASALE